MCLGLLEARSFLHEWVSNSPIDIPPFDPDGPLPLVIVADCLSFFQQLQLGPCRQADMLGHMAWSHLLALAAHRQVYFVFVYSHSGLGFHDDVDASAEIASFLTHRCRRARICPVWWKDAARIVPSRMASEAARSYAIANTRRSRFNPRPNATLSRRQIMRARYLSWLRVGVDPDLGG